MYYVPTLLRLPALTFALSCLVALSACDSNSDDKKTITRDDLGTFSAEASGAFTGTFEGYAAFGLDIDENAGFGLVLVENIDAQLEMTYPSRLLSFFGAESAVPGRNTYTVAPEGDFTGFYLRFQNAESTDEMLLVTDGTLTITTSSADELRGTFELTGLAIDEEGGVTGEAALEGSFTAPFIDIDEIETPDVEG